MTTDKSACPACGLELIVAPRGSDHIAYCPGENGYDGCYGEFGEDPEKAVAKVNYEHEVKMI